MNPFDVLGNLSPNGKLAATAGGTAGVVGAGALAVGGHWQLLLLLALLVVIAIVAFIVFRLLLLWWQKRKSRPMEQSLAGNAGAAPQQVSGAKKLADLDALRRVFATGVEKFHAAGKDLYSLPWYALVGQPGSGKTEAIRHSAIGFPPGLQDQLQGSGGTINMNWWFTNHAIILDTAGRLMFEEVAPGTTSEWQEFLKLLRTHRPNCPINGMLLVIPADSLLKDSGEVIARNAGKIAQQLDMIQRTLGVRFPVFVLITKSDYLTGFSQFFDDLTDPQLQHQIMGWSNAAALDDPFNMDAVENHLR
ncbi:MAG: type VI secretion protein IcmF/TssM N-terminal domain-containing protein, partial [Phycisphaerae bacterium]